LIDDEIEEMLRISQMLEEEEEEEAHDRGNVEDFINA
jgi:hypothetical protein